MSNKLSDKTNKSLENEEGPKIPSQENIRIIEYLMNESTRTEDMNLKYDLSKCIEILQGKENQEYTDIKMSLYEVLMEKERLLKENCEMACELEEYKKSH